MAETEKTKVVDIAPEFGINGDFRKITEYDFADYNSRILPVMALLLMEEGSNQLFPYMGCRNLLVQMPFSTRDEAMSLVGRIERHLSEYSRASTRVSIDNEKSDWFEGDIYLSIEIDGVPGAVSFGIDKKSANGMQPFKISHPSIFS